MPYLRIISLLLSLFPILAQAQGKPIDYSIKVADNIMQHHNHEITKANDGHSHIESYYQEWRYVNGVLGISMLHLADAVHQPKYQQFVKENFDFYFNSKIQKRLKKEYDEGVRDNAWRRFFSMSSLDDCGAMGAALSELQRRYPDKRYEGYLHRIGNYILNCQQRIKFNPNDNGVFCRSSNGERTIWLDDLYMSCSFLAHEGSRMGVPDIYLTTAIQQLQLFDSILYDNQKGAYRHCYYYEQQEPGIAYWGRANGWAFLAYSIVLDRLPKNHPLYSFTLNRFRHHIMRMCQYQDATGMWHQLLDKPDSYPETSCTAMFVYAIAKGVNKGWLDRSYASVANAGWKAIESQVTSDGQLRNVCIGTGISRDLPFYYNRPTPLNDAHGLGAFIMAGIEMERLEIKNK